MSSIGSVHLQEKAPYMLTSVNTNKYIYKQCGEGSIWCHQLNLSIKDWQGSLLINTSTRYPTAQLLHCTMVSLRCKTQQKLNETETSKQKKCKKKNNSLFLRSVGATFLIVTGQDQAHRYSREGFPASMLLLY